MYVSLVTSGPFAKPVIYRLSSGIKNIRESDNTSVLIAVVVKDLMHLG